MPEADTGAPVTSDTLLLASFVSVPMGSTVFDLGCGGGSVMAEAARLNPGCLWIGVDLRLPALCLVRGLIGTDLCEGDFLSLCCSVKDLPSAVSAGAADAVIMNPPFGVQGRGRTSPEESRRVSRSGSDMLLFHFLRAAAHLLAEGGRLYMVARPAMLPDIMMGCGTWGLGPLQLQPVGPPEGPAVHTLVTCRKGAAPGLEILPQRTVEEILGGNPGVLPR
jgi:tRNA1Val (adenine37-N6)-methyltransferase